MTTEHTNWTYNEFLAFLLVYGAQITATITPEELEFIKQRTGIADINRIKARLDAVSDIEALDIIEEYRKTYLNTPEKEQKARQDLEDLLKAQHTHKQLDKVLVHILERII